MTASPENARYFEHITPDNAALLLIDHQVGLMLGVQTQDANTLKSNTVALAKAAKLFDLPVVLTTSGAQGPNGPLMQELLDLFPGQSVIDRTLVNSWDDPAFVEAVEKTGRRKLIMAAITTDVCLAFPAISACGAGYDVYAVLDASGTWNTLVENAAIARMSQAGVIPTSWVAIGAELQSDWMRETGHGLAGLYGERLGPYGFLLNQMAARQ